MDRDRESRMISLCPENCRYRSRNAPFCGFCILRIIRPTKTEEIKMELKGSKDNKKVVTEIGLKDLKKLIASIEDGTVISINMEVIELEQKTE